MPGFKYLFLCFSLFLSVEKAAAQTPKGPWSLDDCIVYALSHNADVRQSTLDLEASKALQAQAKMGLLPTSIINASHGNNSGRSIDPFTNQPIVQQFQTSNLGLNADLNLFSGLQVQNTIKQTSLALKASQQDLKQTHNTISLQVALAYLAVLQNEELLEIANRQVATAKNQLERAGKLVAAGSLAQSTLADLQVQAGNDELDRINALNTLQNSRLALQQLLNLPVTPDFQIQKINLTNAVTTNYDKTATDLYSIAEKNQPSIIGADLRVRSTQKGLQAARGTLYPSLGLFGYVGSNYSSAVPTRQFVADGSGTSTQEVVSPNQYVLINGTKQYITTLEERPNGHMQDFYYFDQLDFNLRKAFGVSLTIPILNSWQARTRISNAIIARKRAEFLAENTRIKLRQEIEQAYSNLLSAKTRHETAQAQAEATTVAYQAAQKRFKNGSVHFVDLNLAKTNFDRAQSNVVRAKYDLVFRKKILDFYQNKPLTLHE